MTRVGLAVISFCILRGDLQKERPAGKFTPHYSDTLYRTANLRSDFFLPHNELFFGALK